MLWIINEAKKNPEYIEKLRRIIMKIAIYARGLSAGSGDVVVYMLALIDNLRRLIKDNDTLYVIHNQSKELHPSTITYKEIRMSSGNRLFCDYFIAPNIINKISPDVTLFLGNVIPFFITGKKAVTMHDMAYYMPELKAYKYFDGIYQKIMIWSSAKRADRIISVSENTRKDIINILNISPLRVKAVLHGLDSSFSRITSADTIREFKIKYYLPNRFILFTGAITPRKNLSRLIDAFDMLCERYTDINLVITGNATWNSSKVFEKIKSNDRIKILGKIHFKELPILYSLAEVYVYPSLYEGFGLPILEAQACGCPVIASNNSSLPEVGAKAVEYIDALNTENIYITIEKLLNSPDRKSELIAKGYANVARFSWEETAKQTLEVLRELGDHNV